MGKTVQISEELYKLLVDVHVYGNDDPNARARITNLLEEKEIARQKRMWYQAMQDQSLDPERRAVAKEMYQELSGIHPDFRY